MVETNEIADEIIFKTLIGKRDKLIEDLRRAENDLKRINIAIEFFQPNRELVSDPGINDSIQADSYSYSQDFTALQQLRFALGRLGSATAPEITDCIYELDKRWPKDKLHKRLTDIASIEYRTGGINGYKSNGRYIYSLKEKK